MYRYGFFRMARTTQAALTCGADIEHLRELGRRYWLVLSRPVGAKVPQNEVAHLLDTDQDGRIRIPEVLAAVDWLKPRLTSFDTLFTGSNALAATDIRQDTPEGDVLYKLFTTLAPEGTLSTTALTAAMVTFKASLANGDGVIPVAAVNPKFAPVAEVILAVTGGSAATDGTKGIAVADVDAFVAAREAYLAWKQGKPELGDTLNGVAPADAVRCVDALTPKMDAFFAACELLRYNPAAQATFTLPTTTEALADAPIAYPTPDAEGVSVTQGVNPAWAAEVTRLGQLLNEELITPALWQKATAAVAPYRAWATAKPMGADCFAGMDERIFEMAGDDAVLQTIREAIATDLAQAPLAAAFDDLKRLSVLRIGFLRFLRNFVNVEELYPPVAKPLFLNGTLYMDERACSLCFPIEKAAAAHAAAAAASKCCLVYCTLSRPAEHATQTILAVFTSGSINNLTVGKNGIFFDLDGKDWEATICHVVPNAISLTEAFFAPWRKVGSAIASTVHKFIAGKNDAATAAMTEHVTSAPTAPANNGMMMASVATLGIALSFIASAVAGLAAAVTNTPIWKTALVVVGIICIVSVPSVILTWLKLRARDLAPILNASDWAINRTIGFTARLGTFFTQRASYLGKRKVCPPMRSCHLVRNLILVLIGIGALTAALWWYCCPTSPRNQTPEQVEPTTTEAVTNAVPETLSEVQ